MLVFKSLMIIIHAYSAVLEIVYLRLDCVFKFQSFVSWICGLSQVLMALSYFCQVVLSHLISSESPLPAVKQKIPPRKTLRIFFWSCVPLLITPSHPCFSIWLLCCTVRCAFTPVMLSPGFCHLGALISWESFNDDLVLQSLVLSASYPQITPGTAASCFSCDAAAGAYCSHSRQCLWFCWMHHSAFQKCP